MFEREHHLRIAVILQALNAEFLRARHCYFGGGTAIILSHHEYRESVDIDFLISDRAGYQDIRHIMTGTNGVQSIFRPGTELTPAREIRSDQYGIRTIFKVAKQEIKFEIILEGRIELEVPGPNDKILGITTLTLLDMVTTKLLANSDRWADDSVFSRDLIDLAMLKVSPKLLVLAIQKANMAYGGSIERDLNRAIQRLSERPERLDVCLSALQMDDVAKALLWKRIKKLATN